jgi:AbrB family looped-hinge helix DNA binding protein
MFPEMKFYGSSTIGSKGQIVIPAEAREELNMKEGGKVIVIRTPRGDGVMILKADALAETLGVMRAHLGSMADFVEGTKEDIK